MLFSYFLLMMLFALTGYSFSIFSSLLDQSFFYRELGLVLIFFTILLFIVFFQWFVAEMYEILKNPQRPMKLKHLMAILSTRRKNNPSYTMLGYWFNLIMNCFLILFTLFFAFILTFVLGMFFHEFFPVVFNLNQYMHPVLADFLGIVLLMIFIFPLPFAHTICIIYPFTAVNYDIFQKYSQKTIKLNIFAFNFKLIKPHFWKLYLLSLVLVIGVIACLWLGFYAYYIPIVTLPVIVLFCLLTFSTWTFYLLQSEGKKYMFETTRSKDLQSSPSPIPKNENHNLDGEKNTYPKPCLKHSIEKSIQLISRNTPTLIFSYLFLCLISLIFWGSIYQLSTLSIDIAVIIWACLFSILILFSHKLLNEIYKAYRNPIQPLSTKIFHFFEKSNNGTPDEYSYHINLFGIRYLIALFYIALIFSLFVLLDPNSFIFPFVLSLPIAITKSFLLTVPFTLSMPIGPEAIPSNMSRFFSYNFSLLQPYRWKIISIATLCLSIVVWLTIQNAHQLSSLILKPVFFWSLVVMSPLILLIYYIGASHWVYAISHNTSAIKG